ncbi:AraC family transcriptional regulator [Mucilaginibacter rubeus]|uniref:AraC family transcriptional regulator n=1 Tax=Mucilaginibacter rubeus TaxID=2027860 RepID=A0AAE6MHK2_9SPHI|nr:MULTISPECIES: helix-turn-helix domain-containing protein [Mucilaginibacter]QEM03710.1 AraC family transcriptional regulator [Mucilaginibacter rubeus]QEM16321.1 AraC family transcriptional regulator [Mucilaginibacter gossypii]QTE40916.1 AraC family transcriptional regulator [Mucilaginibacter rubeus]QTE47519.1 AraC family transcriptional regulator [Mucilaginibacter rubeus]QTE58911.1 AraC family transcriptional regulator [Mucilaginibacter rubeus]
MTAFLNTIILLGALQGFIISILLFFAPLHKLSDRLLGALLFLIALACLGIYLNTQQWYRSNSLLQLIDAIVPFIMVMPIGPLLYFYVRASVELDCRLSETQRKHFYLVIIDLLPRVFVLVILIGALLKFYNRLPFAPGIWIDVYNTYADIPRWISLSAYVIFAWRYLKRQDKPEQLKWLTQCVKGFAVFQFLWLIFLVPYVIPVVSNRLLDAVDWYPIYVPLAILIYWLGINGYLITRQERQLAKPSAGGLANLNDDIIQGFITSITRAMELDQLYLDPELNLSKLAQYTGVSPKNISAVLNQHLQTSFNELVNEYRVRAVKDKILSESFNHLTIAGIAAECGFNSQATFQRSFKQFTGLSPSQFRKNNTHIPI